MPPGSAISHPGMQSGQFKRRGRCDRRRLQRHMSACKARIIVALRKQLEEADTQLKVAREPDDHGMVALVVPSHLAARAKAAVDALVVHHDSCKQVQADIHNPSAALAMVTSDDKPGAREAILRGSVARHHGLFSVDDVQFSSLGAKELRALQKIHKASKKSIVGAQTGEPAAEPPSDSATPSVCLDGTATQLSKPFKSVDGHFADKVIHKRANAAKHDNFLHSKVADPLSNGAMVLQRLAALEDVTGMLTHRLAAHCACVCGDGPVAPSDSVGADVALPDWMLAMKARAMRKAAAVRDAFCTAGQVEPLQASMEERHAITDVGEVHANTDVEEVDANAYVCLADASGAVTPPATPCRSNDPSLLPFAERKALFQGLDAHELGGLDDEGGIEDSIGASASSCSATFVETVDYVDVDGDGYSICFYVWGGGDCYPKLGLDRVTLE